MQSHEEPYVSVSVWGISCSAGERLEHPMRTWVYLREKCSPLGSCAVVAGLLQEDSSVDTTHPWSTPSEAHEHSVSELTELLGT